MRPERPANDEGNKRGSFDLKEGDWDPNCTWKGDRNKSLYSVDYDFLHKGIGDELHDFEEWIEWR